MAAEPARAFTAAALRRMASFSMTRAFMVPPPLYLLGSYGYYTTPAAPL